MKSLGHHRGGGNLNLRGKKYRLLGCRCCAMINKKSEIRERELAQEVRHARASS